MADESDRVLDALSTRSVVLMVGAGSSLNVGYPSWAEFIERMRRELADAEVFADTADLAAFAGRIKETVLQEEGGEARYKEFLENTFRSRAGSLQHDSLHEDLLSLPICGICTTNYDNVLESAARTLLFRQHDTIQAPECTAIDLCDDAHRYRVPRFLRSLTPETALHHVLHLHGHNSLPERMVVTNDDFETQYGREPQGRAFDTLHQRVLWSIAATHPFLFVGFSFIDPYFTRVLEVVYRDFERSEDGGHFATYPLGAGDDKEEIYTRLRKYGVRPIFYEVLDNPSSGRLDHSNLSRLISGLAAQAPEPELDSRRTDAESVTRRMLGR